MSVLEFILDGPWLFCGHPHEVGEDFEAYKQEYDPKKWLFGQVPGTVHTDLMANHLIPDPFRNKNEKEVQWVAVQDWWYRKEVDLSTELVEKQEVWLIFEGLDTIATIWVNGVKVGEANNMFTPWKFNIKALAKSGKNWIVVQFKSAIKVATELEQKYQTKYNTLCTDCSSRPYIRKAQYSFGWDWGPTLPTCGIWRQTKIVAFDKAKLGSIVGLPLEVTAEKAKINSIAQVYAAMPGEFEVTFSFNGYGQTYEKKVSFQAYAGENTIEHTFEIREPKLWWPAGLGEPSLYNLMTKVYSEGQLLDSICCKVGIRKVELSQIPDEEGMTFIAKINDLAVFCKGVNWIPADSFLPNVTEQRYRKLLEATAKMNANIIRVWAGGIYEDDFFYALCDELGIMVWQDFMYACAGYPEEDWFLQEAKREAELTVLRLRGHPSIIVWCGNNENQWLNYTLWKNRDQAEPVLGLPIYENVLSEVCRRLDPTRPYRPSTPFGGEDFSGKHEGHRHNWEVWSKGIDYPAYQEDTGRFLTEFGWQAPPSLKLLETYLDKENVDPNSEAFLAHEKQVGGLELLRKLLALHYPVTDDIKRFVLCSQLNQADALKTAVAHWRSRMFKTSGCIIWQLNDCWPVISWSLIDYGLYFKPAYYAVKRFFTPIIAPILVHEKKLKLYVINESNRILKSEVRFEVMKFNGETTYFSIIKPNIPAYTSQLVFEKDLYTMPLDDQSIFVSTLKDQEKILFQDVKTVGEPKNLKLSAPNIGISLEQSRVGEYSLTLVSDVYAKAVYLRLAGDKGKFSDNFFDLVPKMPKTVLLESDADLSIEDHKKNLSLEFYPY